LDSRPRREAALPHQGSSLQGLEMTGSGADHGNPLALHRQAPPKRIANEWEIAMRSRYAAVATILAALGLSASPSRSDEYPTLNVAQVCHGIADQSDFQEGLSHATFDQCIQAERDERDAMIKQWSTFSADDRRHCIAETTMGGDSSYTELLTCLEIARDVRTLHRQTSDQKQTSDQPQRNVSSRQRNHFKQKHAA
jgi:hypothetical protein